eukprot:243964-Amphidinium_carterae.1
MADHLNWTPTSDGWRRGYQRFSWADAYYKVKWDSALHLCRGVADSRPDFQGLDSGLATQALRQLKLDGQSQNDNAAWHAERREVAIPASVLEAPPCVELHGLLLAPRRQVVINHEPGFGFQAWRSHYTGESPGLKQSVHFAELLATVKRWKNASLNGLSVIAKVWFLAFMLCVPKGAVMPIWRLNNGTREHVPFEPSEEWKQWGIICQAVNHWLLVGPKPRIRPEQWPRVRLPAPEPELPAAPFVVGPHQRVVEHVTYQRSCSQKEAVGNQPEVHIPCGVAGSVESGEPQGWDQ